MGFIYASFECPCSESHWKVPNGILSKVTTSPVVKRIDVPTDRTPGNAT